MLQKKGIEHLHAYCSGKKDSKVLYVNFHSTEAEKYHMFADI